MRCRVRESRVRESRECDGLLSLLRVNAGHRTIC